MSLLLSHDLIQSPLNYMGGKYKLLPQILPLFPNGIDTFVDLCCGGGNVGLNVVSTKTILNDKNTILVSLLKTMMSLGNEFLDLVDAVIDQYRLSQSTKYGYEYYGCKSNAGLASYNKERFLQLRNDFNNRHITDSYYYAMFYVLIIYSFNNQIRFNSHGHFNLPVGKRDYNVKMREKLKQFIYKLRHGNYEFSNLDFRQFDIASVGKNSFVYIDPPYLITRASYNEHGGWDHNDEKDLLCFIDNLHAHKMRFALSNVLSNKGKENTILATWVNNNLHKYKIFNLNHTYNNSNYQGGNRDKETKEVLIINYFAD